jgi:membrane fusion protein (multidrug efflux system)
MKKSMTMMLVAVVVFFGALFGWKSFVSMQMQKQMQAMGMPPVTVSATTAVSASWAPTIKAVGSLRAAQGVDVTPQIAGLVVGLHFDSGDSVEAGDLLVQQYTADEQAQLEGLVAERRLAELNLERTQELFSDKITSKFDFDTSTSALERAQAEEEALRLKIEKRSVRAPFAGQLGIRKIDLGQYIEPGDIIARLEARELILVDFPVPQRRLASLHLNQTVFVEMDAWPGRRFPGVINAIEPRVERETRNIRVRAVVENAQGVLVPGMFAQIEIQLPKQEKVVTVPQSAITFSPYGDSVYVIESVVDEQGQTQQSAVNTFIVAGATRGDQVAISSGLEEGAMVVTSGQQKLRNGIFVNIDNTVAVSNDPNPITVNN